MVKTVWTRQSKLRFLVLQAILLGGAIAGLIMWGIIDQEPPLLAIPIGLAAALTVSSAVYINRAEQPNTEGSAGAGPRRPQVQRSRGTAKRNAQ